MKILLIGYGSIGKRHFNLLSQNKKVTKIDLISRYGSSEHIVHKNIEDMSAEQLQEYDLFFICSETNSHAKQLIYIDNCVKDKIIIVEKPLFHQVTNFSPKNQVVVAYNLRFHPVIEKLQQILSDQKILSFSAFAGQYLPQWRPDQDFTKNYSFDLNKGGGVLRDLSHEIDYTRLLCGSLTLQSAISNSISHLKTQSDDFTTILATNQHKAHIQIQLDYLSYRPKRFIEIQTEKLTISACLIKNKIEIYDKTGFVECVDIGKIDRDYTYTNMHDDLLNNGHKNLTSFEQANDIMHLIDDVSDNYMNKNWRL